MHNPLDGLCILVPRSKNQAWALSQSIEELGGKAIEIPLIAIAEKKLSDTYLQSLLQASGDEWLIFTSSNGVHAFFRQWKQSNNLHAKIAVIGEKTKNTLSSYGYDADFIPTSYVAERFIVEFIPLLSKQNHIYVIKGNLARDYIALELKKVCEQVEEVILYETYFPEESEIELVNQLKENRLDILSFTSTSTVEHFMGIVKKHNLLAKVKNCLVVSIGPITTDCLHKYGIVADITAYPYTIDAMMKDLVIYITNRIGESKHD